MKHLNLSTLDVRRESSCSKFAKNCLKNEKLKDIFPKTKSEHKMKKRKSKKFQKRRIKTQRYKKSAVPYMTKLLNDDHDERRIILNDAGN